MRMRGIFAWLKPGRVAVTPPPVPVLTPAVQRHYACTDDDGFLLWPNDPDEVPAWRLELEERARIYGLSIPSYLSLIHISEPTRPCH
jgi:hypothetical protein